MILNCIHSVISTISEVDEALLGVLGEPCLTDQGKGCVRGKNKGPFDGQGVCNDQRSQPKSYARPLFRKGIRNEWLEHSLGWHHL